MATRGEVTIAIMALALLAASILTKLERRPTVGGDLAMVCGSLAAMDAGENPYDRATLARYAPNPGLPITYPPLANRLFTPACSGPPLEAVWIGVAGLAFWVMRRWRVLSTWPLLAVVFAGFGAFEWTLLMGNTAIAELLVMALALEAVRQGRMARFGWAVAFLTFLKLSPAIYLATIAGAVPRRALARIALVAVVGFGALHLFSLWMDPAATAAYWTSIASGFDGFLDAERARGGERHPALVSLCGDVSALAGGGVGLTAVLAAAGVGLAAIGVARVWRTRGDRASLEIIAYLLLTVVFISPRVKPYTFMAIVPAVAILIGSFDVRRRLLAIALTCVAPTLAFAATALLKPDGLTEPALGYKILFGYSQLYAVAAVMFLTTRNVLGSPNLREPLMSRTGSATVAVVLLSSLGVLAQAVAGTPTNDAPNPYVTETGWARMPDGRSWGATSAVDVDRDGISIWVAERCGANTCWDAAAGKPSQLDVVLKFDEHGTLVRSFGQGLFVFPHGIHVDRDGNVWVTDGQDNYPRRPRGAAADSPLPPMPSRIIGHQVYKFSPEGRLLLTLGKAGGNRPNEPADPASFYQPNDVITNAAGDIFVAEGHGSTHARIAKFDRGGRFIKAWGTRGSEPGQMDQPHALAFDSQGRLVVADRSNNRLQIFDQDGGLLEHGYQQFSRLSGIWIDPQDVLYGTDSESGSVAAARKDWKRGIRIGSLREGPGARITAFIPDPAENPPSTSAAEGIAVDHAGRIYGAEVGPRALKRYVRQQP